MPSDRGYRFPSEVISHAVYVVYAGRKFTRRRRLRPIQGTDNARFAQEKVNLPKVFSGSGTAG